MSTAEERLAEFAEASKLADSKYDSDLMAAQEAAADFDEYERLAAQITANRNRLFGLAADAAIQALTATGAGVESAYAEAKRANAEIDAARRRAERIVEIIKGTATAADALKALFDKATGAGGEDTAAGGDGADSAGGAEGKDTTAGAGGVDGGGAPAGAEGNEGSGG